MPGHPWPGRETPQVGVSLGRRGIDQPQAGEAGAVLGVTMVPEAGPAQAPLGVETSAPQDAVVDVEGVGGGLRIRKGCEVRIGVEGVGAPFPGAPGIGDQPGAGRQLPLVLVLDYGPRAPPRLTTQAAKAPASWRLRQLAG